MCTMCQALTPELPYMFHAGVNAPTIVTEAGDVTANTATVADIAPGEVFLGSVGITSAGDTADWIKVSIPAGATYLFFAQEADDPFGTLTPTVTLYGATGGFIADETYSLPDASVLFYTNATGSAQTVFMEVSDAGNGAMSYGATALNAVLEGSTDAVGNTATVASMTETDVYVGSVGGSDVSDWIEVVIDAYTSVEFFVIELGDTTGVWSPYTTLFDAAGNPIANEFAYDNYSSQLNYSNTTGTAQTVYLEVQNYGGSSVMTYGVSYATEADTPPAELTEFTYEQIADQLTQGYWDSVAAPNPVAWDVDPTSFSNNSIDVDISRLTAPGQLFATAALQAWTFMTGIEFNFTNLVTLSTNPGSVNYLQPGATTQGMIFDDEDAGAAYAFWQSSGTHTTSVGSTSSIYYAGINIAQDWIQDDFNSATGEIYLDSYSFQTYIHEIGHALGLGHAGNYNGSASYPTDADYLNDSWQATVMSYFSQTTNTFINADFAYIVSPMIADIMAVQDLYGVAGDLRTGDTTYGFNSTAGGYYDDITSLGLVTAFTILDDGGIDTIDLSGATQTQLIDLTPGSISNVVGKTGNMVIYSDGAGVDTLIENVIGGSGSDTIIGNTANNSLVGGLGIDTIHGENGNDTIVGGAGADSMTGGAGTDTLSYALAGAAVRISLAGGTGTGSEAQGDTFSGFENIVGSAHNDTLIGGGGANILYGGNGNDYLLDQTNGNDTLYGGAGNDALQGSGGADSYFGGDNIDTVRFTNSASGVTVDLGLNVATGGDAAGDTFDGVENLSGSQHADLLIGDSGANRLEGYLGNDTLRGGAGADVLYGDLGFDVADYSDSGVGVDVGIYRTGIGGTASGDVLIYMEAIIGSDHDDVLVGAGLPLVELYGGDGNDLLYDYGGTSNLYGGEGKDTLIGSLGADNLDGGSGVDVARYANAIGAVTINLLTGTGVGADAAGDTLVDIENVVGGNFADTIIGDGADNRIEGLGGADTIEGGLGNDYLIGGAGVDSFVFKASGWGNDIIVDFLNGTDKFNLGGSGATFADFNVVTTGAGCRLDFLDVGGQLHTVALLGVLASAIDSSDFIL